MLRPAGPVLIHLALAVLAGAGGAAGCGPAQQETPEVPADRAGLLAWDGHQHEVFDDNIDPAAVGLTLDGSPSPRSDRFLRERAQTAEVVARVRVNTVTVDKIGEETSYLLAVLVGYPPLTTPKLQDRTFELHIRPTSLAFGIAKAFDARLRGLTFIAFIRRYSSEAGEPEIHWHLSSDTAEVAAAVNEAVALGELSAR